MSDCAPLGDADRMRIDDLLDGLLEDGGDAQAGDDAQAGAGDLVARLEMDPAARDYLLDRAALHAGLRRSLQRRRLSAWAIESSDDRPTAGPPRGGRFRPVAWLAAAACLLVGIASWRSWAGPSATVTAGVGTAGLVTGDVVFREPHELKAGVLELETRRGAKVVIEAPASFCFESPQRLRMQKGRVAADVPKQASGFTIVTPSGEAIDLGTRFAVDVPASGDAEVHVFDGEVIARDVGRGSTNLRDGEAFSLSARASRELRSAAFIRTGEVPQLAAAVAAGQERRACESADRLRRDPALIATIDFEKDEPPGQYRVVQGRWPGSRAADFTHVGDHLPVDAGGDNAWPQLTVAAWVRLDRLGEPYQSLYHTDGWTSENPGQVHWMIVGTGVMRLALREWKLRADAVERHGHPESRTSVLGAEGRWMYLAFVYDSEARTASFYVDGRPDGVTSLEVAPPARLGPARIGNWNDQDRTLSGRIDELVFVGRALSAAEIRSLYEAGVPYR